MFADSDKVPRVVEGFDVRTLKLERVVGFFAFPDRRRDDD